MWEREDAYRRDIDAEWMERGLSTFFGRNDASIPPEGLMLNLLGGMQSEKVCLFHDGGCHLDVCPWGKSRAGRFSDGVCVWV